MNKNKLKVYAPQAREEFIKIVNERAALYGITAKKIEPCQIKGDYAFISGKPFPKSTEKSRDELVKRIESKGFSQVMEEAAYSWFNRFAAIRFMELNGYLSHGYRVLSHPQGQSEPEILEKAHYLERLDGLEKEEIIALKTAGNKDAELYRKLIIAQCNELHSAMPFLFERVDDPTELLLPDNLLNTDSVIRQMVKEIPEEDWKEVEIIGWLYQFYISEKKDALMKAKKAYKTEDIPAVTQLFTPNWIVKYLVQNSLGAKWLATYPSSSLKDKMEYYIEPAEQTDEVKQQLKEITPDSLNPEELTVMDPACGSGHILVEAYDLLKEIYLERGFRPKDIPALVLTKNLYGLEIDDRAAQLAGFALMMKARQDDRQIFEKQIKPNITCLKSANGMGGHFKEARELIELFDNAKTFGSLIRIPEDVRDKLPQIKEIADKKRSGDLFEQKDAEIVTDLLRQAEFLSQRYDCVIANPPYMGSKGMNAILKEFAHAHYPTTKSDLFAMFIERGFELAKGRIGFNAMVTMQSWMFLSSFEKCRELWIQIKTITTMAHLGARAFSTISGEVVTVTAFTFINEHIGEFKPTFLRLIDGDEEEKRQGIIDKGNAFTHTVQDDFNKIPDSPIAYWVSERVRKSFEENRKLGQVAEPTLGLKTGDNDYFLKEWYEVNICCMEKKRFSINEKSTATWFPYNKGGGFRKWAGNKSLVVNWRNDGEEIKSRDNSSLQGYEKYFNPGITWSGLTSSIVSFRESISYGAIFDTNKGPMLFGDSNLYHFYLGLLNCKISPIFLCLLNPTISVQTGDLKRIPIPLLKDTKDMFKIKEICLKCIETSGTDWDFFETSWDFTDLPILSVENKKNIVNESYRSYRKQCREMTQEIKHLEEENNKLFIGAYGLQDELSPEVPREQITLFANPKYRYRGELSDEELETRFKTDTMKELLSYAVGCMMGRYSLDNPGLIYAHSGNESFDATQYKTFPADDDGIVPIADQEWFDDDAACRFFRFIETAWNKKGLDANLDFIAEAIGRKGSESSREAIRRYFVNDFYKNHCHTYKKRPIYWLFTSGKENAFQALVYLHRYNEGTLSRMRTEYVLPLQTKIHRHIEHLEKDKENATSTSAANKIQKEISSLLKQKEELIKFDERLRHYTDMKIKLDLDDGVKVNYAKFGELLADVKKIAGTKEEKDESAD
ncbi:MAG: BREX-1 system adenine-specific DNA-methyltransferase PglX [Candidatus Omnitrophica bacterium]|nr:BREX-1 system adenine-specific DNA-methyltransferase PglX [Candidatus Omnitrophota bacterium]